MSKKSAIRILYLINENPYSESDMEFLFNEVRLWCKSNIECLDECKKMLDLIIPNGVKNLHDFIKNSKFG